MADAQASEAARSLARARWGTRKLDQAVETVVERRADLEETQRAQLREITGPEDTDE